MGKKPNERVPLGDEQNLTHNPFAALIGKQPTSALGGHSGGSGDNAAADTRLDGRESSKVGRSTVEVRRERKGRGGKVVTLVTWLAGAPPEPLEEYARDLARSLGTGARVEDGRIVIQGDLTARAAAILEKVPDTQIVLATQ